MEKGKTNNPNGRPKGKINKVRKMLQEQISDKTVTMCIRKLEKLAGEGNTDAIKYLLDQKFGKATQRTELTGEDGKKVQIDIVYRVATQ